MICNKVLIALTALIAVTAATPYFLQKNQLQGFEAEYEDNPQLWGNAPLKQKANLKWGEWGYPNDQTASEADVESDVEAAASEVEEAESEEAELEGADQTGPAAGGGSSGNQDPAAGGALGGEGGNSGNADPGANAAAFQPVVAAEAQAGAKSVYAAGGPAPGQLKASASRGQGLGIAIGLCLLVVATSAIAVFAIRRYWRHRL